MAGLDPAISLRLARPRPGAEDHTMRGGWVYIVTNRRYGTLYVGVTANLPRRAWEHREGLIDGFTKQYGLKLLVWAEHHDDIRSAIQREKHIKHWPRTWKIDLIETSNPEWEDLYQQFVSLR